MLSILSTGRKCRAFALATWTAWTVFGGAPEVVGAPPRTPGPIQEGGGRPAPRQTTMNGRPATGWSPARVCAFLVCFHLYSGAGQGDSATHLSECAWRSCLLAQVHRPFPATLAARYTPGRAMTEARAVDLEDSATEVSSDRSVGHYASSAESSDAEDFKGVPVLAKLGECVRGCVVHVALPLRHVRGARMPRSHLLCFNALCHLQPLWFSHIVQTETFSTATAVLRVWNSAAPRRFAKHSPCYRN